VLKLKKNNSGAKRLNLPQTLDHAKSSVNLGTME